MPRSDLAAVTNISLTRAQVEETLASLQLYGRSRYEGLVLWLGAIEGERATVEHVLTPPQNPISGEDGVGYFVSGETLFHLNRTLAEHGLRLLAQVHSHPGAAYHSSTDDRFAIVTTDGGLSLVVPDFGKAPADLATWAIYRLDRTQWRRVPGAGVASLFTVSEP